MTTRETLIAEIQSDMERPDPEDADLIRTKINAAIRHYAPVRFWFNESDSITFNTVIGTDTYTFTTIATAFYDIDAVFVTFASGDLRQMEFVDWVEQRFDTQASTETGEPEEVAYGNRSLKFFPIPDDVYSVRLLGHFKLAGPSSDTSSADTEDNDWFTHAYDLILCRAKAELYAHTWMDVNAAQVMTAAESSALSSLQHATFDKVRTGYIMATDF